MRLAPLAAFAAALLAVPATAAADDLRPTARSSTSARVVVATVARAAPGGGPVVARLTPESPWAGGALHLLVLRSAYAPDGTRWLRVRLPRRPNGAAGWIPRDHVELAKNAWRVEVSLAYRRLVVRRAGSTVARFAIGIGAAATPTPRGLFAVSESFRTTQPGVGPWAIALTAFSDTHTWFAGGPGLIAIHGARDLRRSTNGCIVLDPWVVPWLARTLPPATPVVVR